MESNLSGIIGVEEVIVPDRDIILIDSNNISMSFGESTFYEILIARYLGKPVLFY